MDYETVAYETVVDEIFEFFEGEYFRLGRVVGIDKVKGKEQGAFGIFDSVYVDQGGGGLTGDDFHGTVYFHIGDDNYATAEY